MNITLIDSMGSDLTVCNAARVSMDKESEWDFEEGEDEYGIYYDYVLSEKDKKLVSYLAKHKHWTPFSHCTATFRVKAPIFVARQLFKHKVGLTENEISRRYVDTVPEFYVPDVWRKRAENVKQGSSDEGVVGQMNKLHRYYDFLEEVLHLYDQMIKEGVAPEQARMILPQSMYTEWYWTGSMSAFARVCKLRLDPHAQKETQMIAQMINDECAKLWPVSWAALMEV